MGRLVPYQDEEDTEEAVVLRNVGIMIDLETFGVGNDSVVWQAAVVPFDLDDPLTENMSAWMQYFPTDPQHQYGFKFDASTIEFWMEQPDAARRKMIGNLEGDDVMLHSRINDMHRVISNLIREADTYEVWVKGLDFDIPKVRKLFEVVGKEAPWKYDTVRCLRTAMKLAMVVRRDVTPQKDFVAHSAYSDCKYQIRQYAAVQKALGSGVR